MIEPSRARHVYEEHTGELQLRLEGPDRAALFEEAAVALAEIAGDERDAGRQGAPSQPGPWERVRVVAPDPEALLVAWIDELIFRMEDEHRIFTRIAIERLADRELVARIAGPEVSSVKTQVKAATFHGLHLEEGQGHASATLVLDV